VPAGWAARRANGRMRRASGRRWRRVAGGGAKWWQVVAGGAR
jgi:hypothetical protein